MDTEICVTSGLGGALVPCCGHSDMPVPGCGHSDMPVPGTLLALGPATSSSSFSPLKRFSWPVRIQPLNKILFDTLGIEICSSRMEGTSPWPPFDTIEIEICGSSGAEGAEPHFGAKRLASARTRLAPDRLASPPDSLHFQALWRSWAWQLDRLFGYLIDRHCVQGELAEARVHAPFDARQPRMREARRRLGLIAPWTEFWEFDQWCSPWRNAGEILARSFSWSTR